MKPEEIIKYLEMVRPVENYSHAFSVSVGNTRHFGSGSQLNKDVSTAIDLAIQALAKQISKSTLSRIESLGNHRYELFNDCPSCKVDLRQVVKSDYLSKYCPECGQKVRWK